jgi:hypothetical protein
MNCFVIPFAIWIIVGIVIFVLYKKKEKCEWFFYWMTYAILMASLTYLVAVG